MTYVRSSCLSPAALIEIWERGAASHQLDQALLVIRLADGAGASDDPSDWTIGRRDRRLLEIRRDTFGDRIESYAGCPACRSRLEFELSCNRFLEPQEGANPLEQTIEHDGRQWTIRAPNSRDLAVATLAPDLSSARAGLLARCLRPAGESDQNSPSLSSVQEGRLLEHLAMLDPLAEILLDLTCQVCGHTWQCVFDIATFLCSEIRMRSRRVLQEIDVLARTYGWTESEILRLSDRRRGLYVQMALS